MEDLKLLKNSYEGIWKAEGKRKRVTYEKIIERLLSKSGLGHVDPDVYVEYTAARESRKKLPEVVKRATKKVVDGLAAKSAKNGASLKGEALKD